MATRSVRKISSDVHTHENLDVGLAGRTGSSPAGLRAITATSRRVRSNWQELPGGLLSDRSGRRPVPPVPVNTAHGANANANANANAGDNVNAAANAKGAAGAADSVAGANGAPKIAGASKADSGARAGGTAAVGNWLDIQRQLDKEIRNIAHLPSEERRKKEAVIRAHARAKWIGQVEADRLDPDRLAEAQQQHAAERLREATPLTLENLTRLPTEAADGLKNLRNGSESPALTAVISQLWHAVEKNTNYLRRKWDLVRHRDDFTISQSREARAQARIITERFDDIHPVRHSIIADPVRSASAGEPRYLHANAVDLDCGLQFIASQKPMPMEIAGFHQVLLDKNVGLIIDLTNNREKEPDNTYVPAQKKSMQAPGSKVKVTCESGLALAGRTLRSKQLRLEDGDRQCQVQRLHFKAWPDQGIVSSAHLIEIADRAEAHNPDPTRPIVVHCRAGVGRTGTLIGFMAARRILQRELAANGGACTVEQIGRTLMDVVARGRLQRGPYFVQSGEQFALVMRALLETFPVEAACQPEAPEVSPAWLEKPSRLETLVESPDEVVENPQESNDEEPTRGDGLRQPSQQAGAPASARPPVPSQAQATSQPVQPQARPSAPFVPPTPSPLSAPSAPSESAARSAPSESAARSAPTESAAPSEPSSRSAPSRPSAASAPSASSTPSAPSASSAPRSDRPGPIPRAAASSGGDAAGAASAGARRPADAASAGGPPVGGRRVPDAAPRSLWQALARRYRKPLREHQVPVAEVGENTPDVPCPRQTALQVWLGRGAAACKSYLHANRIRFRREPLVAVSIAPATGAAGLPSPTVRTAPIAKAGQSPQTFALCEKFLLEGIASGQGLFQFVAPETHLQPAQSTERTIINQLFEQLQRARETSQPLVLGGRYRVRNAEEQDTHATDARCVRITVDDLEHPGQSRSVVVTQAGLRFDDNVLRAAEIDHANTLLESHRDAVGTRAGVAAAAAGDGIIERDASDPMIVSYSGIGRNAALICYREALARLDEVNEPEDIDRLLEQIVAQGRQDRGPGFIHSEYQLDELRAAVLKQYVRRLRAPH